jgi:hypothetical protein
MRRVLLLAAAALAGWPPRHRCREIRKCDLRQRDGDVNRL